MGAGLGQAEPRALRLLTVAAALCAGTWSLDELRARLGLYDQPKRETGRTQFERDKQSLLEAGLHVRTLDEHRYRVDPAPDQRFDDAELAALNALAGIVDDPATGAALAAFTAGADAYPQLGAGARVHAAPPAALEGVADVLLEAADAGDAVRFAYRGANAPVSERHVEPWALRCRRGLWYLLAHDRDRGEHRHFRLDRIVDDVVPDGPATSPRPALLPTDLLPGDEGEVVLRLTERGRFDARRLGAAVDPEHDADGPALARFPALRDEAALGFALRHDAVVVDPPGLEEERRTRADRVADLHGLAAPAAPAELDRPPRSSPALDPARLRRLLVLPAWARARPEVTVDEAATGLGCTVEELRYDVALLGRVELPELGSVFDLAVEDDVLTGWCQLHPSVHLSALDRSRVRSLVDSGRAVLHGGSARPGLAALDRRLQDVAVAVDPDVAPAVLRVLRTAATERRVVRFLHRRRDEHEPRVRTVTPTELAFVDGQTYLVGWDHDRADGRAFRLDRITDVEAGRLDDEPREVELGRPTYVPTGEETEVVLRCTHVGSWVLARLAPRHRVDLDDGSVWAVVATDTPRLVVDHVLVAGGEAEVVAPAALREAVAERARLVR